MAVEAYGTTVGSNLPAMALTRALQYLRVGWWAGGEPSDPLAALAGSLLRAEMAARCPGLRPVLVHGALGSWSWVEPGFTGEPVAELTWAGEQPAPLDLLIASGRADPGGAKLSHALAQRGTLTIAVAPGPSWGLQPAWSVGPPFAVPEPTVLAARHLPGPLLEARGAFLRAVEGLPERYVLVEGALLERGDGEVPARPDLERALACLAEAAGDERPAEVVRLAPGPLCADDPVVQSVLAQRRAEAEEARHQAEDWPGRPERPRLPLRVTNPLDLAAAVAGASAVVAGSGALMALAWALGAAHVALAAEGSPASDFAAWTGDASALAEQPTDVVGTVDNILGRRGRPPGLNRLEATLDQALDEAASNLVEAAPAPGDAGAAGLRDEVSVRERLHELEAVNEALRLRLAAERLRFGERAALLEKAASTTVESAIKAVHGQDVIIRRRLEQTEKEMRRLQEETAVQQAELKAIYGTLTMRAITPARHLYGRLRKAAR
jgi:hypothetical protein